MEKIPKIDKCRASNKAVGLGNVGLAYIPESRVYEYLLCVPHLGSILDLCVIIRQKWRIDMIVWLEVVLIVYWAKTYIIQ